MSRAEKSIARVHVDGYDPEVYEGENALLMADVFANQMRDDFPGACVGVSYTPLAAKNKKRLIMESMGFSGTPLADRIKEGS